MVREVDPKTISRVTRADESTGKARITSQSEIGGTQFGLVGVMMGYMDFRLIDGRWLITGISSIQGFDLLCCNGM